MAMANRYDGMTAIEVEILLSLVVVHIASLAMVDSYIKKRIYVKEFHIKGPTPQPLHKGGE